jgi:hypothetical protein
MNKGWNEKGCPVGSLRMVDDDRQVSGWYIQRQNPAIFGRVEPKALRMSCVGSVLQQQRNSRQLEREC